jgi:hypothetical protein
LPQVHATARAERSGDPLAYALCGIGGSTGLAAELRGALPAEVVAALDASHAAPALPDCHACVGAHAAAAVQTPPMPFSAAGADAATAATAASAQRRSRHERPPVRGPPVPV